MFLASGRQLTLDQFLQYSSMDGLRPICEILRASFAGVLRPDASDSLAGIVALDEAMGAPDQEQVGHASTVPQTIGPNNSAPRPLMSAGYARKL